MLGTTPRGSGSAWPATSAVDFLFALLLLFNLMDGEVDQSKGIHDTGVLVPDASSGWQVVPVEHLAVDEKANHRVSPDDVLLLG
jgi:hypothetical protein